MFCACSLCDAEAGQGRKRGNCHQHGGCFHTAQGMGTEIDMQDVEQSCGIRASAVEPRKRRFPLALLAALACALTLFGGDGGPKRADAQTVLTCTIDDATSNQIFVKPDGSACSQRGLADAVAGHFFVRAWVTSTRAGTVAAGYDYTAHNGCTSSLGNAAAGGYCNFFNGGVAATQSITANFIST